MQLTFYKLTSIDIEIVPARPTRTWMDAYRNKNPYRCLPLTIANTFGWFALAPFETPIAYTGGNGVDDIKVTTIGTNVPAGHFASSHFGRGVLTFHTGHLFRTEPGWSLFAAGPLNEPKDGMYPLSGVVESDWLPFTFTMNFQLTRPGIFTVAKGEPFLQVFPVRHENVSEVQPVLRSIGDDAQERDEYAAFWTHRYRRNEERSNVRPGEEEAWQKSSPRFYFIGRRADRSAAPRHVTRIRPRPLLDMRGKPAGAVGEAAVGEAAGGEVPEGAAAENLAGTRRGCPVDPDRIADLDPDAGEGGALVQVRSFLSAAQCAVLLREAAEMPMPAGAGGEGCAAGLGARSFGLAALRLMQQAGHAAGQHLAAQFGEERMLFPEPWKMLVLPAGSMLAPVPAAPDDGHRRYAAFVHLGGDAEGGELCLPGPDRKIRPEAGLLVAIRSAAQTLYGVTRVTAGTRVLLALNYTTDRRYADQAALSVY